ncbi:MAG: tetratricopeptide repeat protein [Clostridiales bacterium]|nr:tetratricopeptide repeat protein [Clostridiales bacterium]
MKSSTLLTITRVSIASLVVAVVVVAGLVLDTVMNPRNAGTPTTEGERTILVSERAVQAAPDDPEARSRLAAAYLSVGRNADALREAEYAIRLDPELGNGYLVKGMVERALGRYEQAVASLQQALGLGENETADWRFLLQMELAEAYKGLDDLESARDALTEALASFPEAANIYYERGRIAEQMGDLEFALQDFQTVLTFIPDDEAATEAIARVSASIEASPSLEASPAPQGSE